MEAVHNTTVYDFMAEWYGPWESLHTSRAQFWRWAIFLFTGTGFVVGIPANIMVFVAVSCFKELQKLSHAFIVNLAVCDSIVMLLDTFVFLGAFFGEQFWEDRFWLCEVSGSVCIIACFGSLWNMLMIAVNRLLFIKNQDLYKKVFGRAGTVASVVLLWIMVYFLDLPNALYVGLSKHRYNPTALHCDFSFGNWWYNTFFYTGFAFTLPVTGVITCYLMIIATATKSASNTRLSEKRQRDQKQLVRSLLLLLATFVATWGPLALLYGMEYNVMARPEYHMVLEAWAHFNSAINPLIYGFTHSGFRRAYKKILSKLLPTLVADPDTSQQQTAASSTNNANAPHSTAPPKMQNSHM